MGGFVISDPIRHESFATVQLSRCQGSGRFIFGSDLSHNHSVWLTITRADLHRELKSDRVMPTDSLITVELTELQFGQLLSSMGVGEGVPASLLRFNGEAVEATPDPEKMGTILQEFKDDLVGLSKMADDLFGNARELSRKPGGLKAGEKKELLEKVATLVQQVKHNIPFIGTQLQRTMDRMTEQAKGEISAALTNAVEKAGLEALKLEVTQKSLPEDTE